LQKPEIHLTDKKENVHGFHLRGVPSERNRIYINAHIVDAIEAEDVDTSRWFELIFLLLATLAHEYGHWVNTLLSPDEDTPEKLGYPHARGGALQGRGESGYVSEIAIFGGFTQCSSTGTGRYYNFRITDKNNVSYRLPIDVIKESWAHEIFLPFTLDSLIELPGKHSLEDSLLFGPGSAKKSKVGETLVPSNPEIPLCPCAHYLFLAEMHRDVISARKPVFPNGKLFASACGRLDTELNKLEQTKVR
jgi:hypothetical protein